MRKVVALLVLFAFSVLTLAVPAFAAVAAPEKIPMAYYGKVVYSKIEIPHYELVNPKTNSVYVLTGPFNFKTYEGKLVWVEGQEIKVPNIYQRGPILKVTNIRLDSNSASAPDPKPVTISVRDLMRKVAELINPILKALDLSVAYSDGAFVITNLANGKTVILKF